MSCRAAIGANVCPFEKDMCMSCCLVSDALQTKVGLRGRLLMPHFWVMHYRINKGWEVA
jgi:hypothetical protein